MGSIRVCVRAAALSVRREETLMEGKTPRETDNRQRPAWLTERQLQSHQ